MFGIFEQTKLYQQLIKPDPAFEAAFGIWLEYEVVCERYDRHVCTGPIGPGGGILTAYPWEREAINRNAMAQRKRALFALGTAGVNAATSEAARHAVQRMSYERQLELRTRRQVEKGAA